jgi:hypothetical protein
MFLAEIEAGLVTTVLGDYELERRPIHLVYPSRRFVSAKVRAVSDFLAEELQTEPALLVGAAAENASRQVGSAEGDRSGTTNAASDAKTVGTIAAIVPD